MWFRHVYGLATFSLLHTATASVPSTGLTVSLGGVSYFLPPAAVAIISVTEELKTTFGNGGFIPLTVFRAAVDGYGEVELGAAVTKYLDEDDVFQSKFLEAIYVLGDSHTFNPSRLYLGNLSSTVISGTYSGQLNTGPYFLSSTGEVYEAWRLYSDTNAAFTESSISNGDGTYSVLPAGTFGQRLTLAVPSRLYFAKTAEKPLAGIRIGIKDIYDVSGLRTSNGNRAWYWLYPPANNTATPVQRLIDAGAIVVGKMITSQFANGEVATADWVDYQEAFNPRGDGYQDTSSSSSGSGAGAAAYAWLDATLGSDTGGSVRGPAQVQGVYGNRPSHGLVSLEHTMPMSPVLDTPGLLARDPQIWKSVAKAMYGANITFSSTYPSRILTYDWPTSADSVANALLLDFLANLTSFLGTKATTFNYTMQWAEDRPDAEPLELFFNLTYATLITKQQVPLVREPFYRDYAAKHDGRRPFVNPVPLARWGWGDNATATVQEAVANITTFTSWINSTVLVPDEQSCSNSLLLYVGSTGETNYRNIYRTAPRGPPFGFGISGISGFSETPDFVVPIGEAPYNSTVTQHVEYLPVTVDFMAAKGCDGMLFELIEDLYKAGILKKALPGQSGITGGDVLSRREMGE